MNTSFGPRINRNKWDFHDGIDLPAPIGTKVHAMRRGKVHRAGPGNPGPGGFSSRHVVTAQAIHGLVSNSEWAGVKLSTLLDEAGVDPKAKWLIAEGADAHLLDRSVPMKKAYDDAMVVIYQNGERLMPGNGYPMRLLLRGYQGNMNVKFLRRIKAVDQAAMSFFETKNYSQILPGGKTWRFHFLMEVKSFITQPSFSLNLKEPGFYSISGVAYSGGGRIAKVTVSADGGKSWGEAALQGPVHDKAFTRFVMPWRWDGQPAILQSRAWGRRRQRSTVASRVRRGSRSDQTAVGQPSGVSEPALQQYYELVCR